MRVLSLITSFTSGGAETLVTNLSCRFSQAGHRSVVTALCDAEILGNDPAFEKSLQAKVIAAGGEARSLALSAGRRPLEGMAALRRLIRDVRPDIIHAHTARALPMLWLVRAAAPVVLTHHNTRFSFPLALFHLFDRVVDEYVAISDASAALIAPHGKRAVTTIRNAADTAFFAGSPRSLRTDEVRIISVGALSEQKDYPTLIHAAKPLRSLLARRGKTARLSIVGGGAMRPELELAINREGVADMVELLGTRSDVRDLLSEADLLVNSSLYEGLPVAVLEAMAMGLPVVATDVPGNAHIVEDGVNGLLAPGREPDALAIAMDRALADPIAYESLSVAALKTAGRHSMEAYADRHLRLYDRLCSRPDRVPDEAKAAAALSPYP